MSAVSIIIVNWNTRDLLRKCLESVPASPQSEIIVVDNASTDGSAEMVTGSFPQVRLIRSKSNSGFAAANNLGLRTGRPGDGETGGAGEAKSGGQGESGGYVMLLNPDAELCSGALERMVEFADAHQDVAAVGPKLLNTDGSLQKNGRKFPSLLREFLHITKLYRLMPGTFDRKLEWGRDDFDRSTEVDSICGACMLVRRSAIEQVGLLDERFFMYYEEVDWCYRMKQAGWKIFYLPDAQVVHHVGQGSKQIGLAKMQIAYKSQYEYFLKHHGPVQAAILKALSSLALMLMCLKQGAGK